MTPATAIAAGPVAPCAGCHDPGGPCGKGGTPLRYALGGGALCVRCYRAWHADVNRRRREQENRAWYERRAAGRSAPPRPAGRPPGQDPKPGQDPTPAEIEALLGPIRRRKDRERALLGAITPDPGAVTFLTRRATCHRDRSLALLKAHGFWPRAGGVRP